MQELLYLIENCSPVGAVSEVENSQQYRLLKHAEEFSHVYIVDNRLEMSTLNAAAIASWVAGAGIPSRMQSAWA